MTIQAVNRGSNPTLNHDALYREACVRGVGVEDFHSWLEHRLNLIFIQGVKGRCCRHCGAVAPAKTENTQSRRQFFSVVLGTQ